MSIFSANKITSPLFTQKAIRLPLTKNSTTHVFCFFYSRDFGLDSTTLTKDSVRKMYLHTQNELSRSSVSKVIVTTNRQTDRHQQTIHRFHAAMRVVNEQHSPKIHKMHKCQYN